jgi:hypothetical protein
VDDGGVLRTLADVKPPLYLAAGGGGDAIAAAMLHAARWPGVRPTMATFAWDRLMVDPIPGPRSVTDFDNLRRLDERNFAITGETRPIPPAGSTLPRLASEVDATFVLLDPARGAVGLREQVAALVATTGADRVEVVDVGGDILGTGTEPELKSPLADALALAATEALPVPVEVLVAGAGLDGELSEELVLARIGQLWGRRVMRVGADEAAWAMPLFDWHPSEATALLVAAGRGLRGDVEIRGGGHRVHLTDESPNVYTVAHAEVFAINQPAQATAAARTLPQVEAAVRAVCGDSEIDYERNKAAEIESYPSNEPSVDTALDQISHYVRSARSRGFDYATFRRLAEVARLDAAGAADLRDQLIRLRPTQYEAPLWRLFG